MIIKKHYKSNHFLKELHRHPLKIIFFVKYIDKKQYVFKSDSLFSTGVLNLYSFYKSLALGLSRKCQAKFLS